MYFFYKFLWNWIDELCKIIVNNVKVGLGENWKRLAVENRIAIRKKYNEINRSEKQMFNMKGKKSLLPTVLLALFLIEVFANGVNRCV